jgi:hypothetical protein
MINQSETLKTPIPEKFTVQQGAGGLWITYRWFSPSHIFLAFFCLIWFGFLAFWYKQAIEQNASWSMLAFPLIHLAAGVVIAYTTLAGFLNSTTVTVGQGKLAIHHSPLPWPGNKEVQTTEIVQIYCEERLIRSRNGTRVEYRLSAISHDDRKIKLLGRLNESDQARFLERKIEEYLGIENKHVEGELSY